MMAGYRLVTDGQSAYCGRVGQIIGRRSDKLNPMVRLQLSETEHRWFLERNLALVPASVAHD